MKNLIAITFCVLFSIQSAYSTHIVGGNMAYEYMGKVGNNYRYKITFQTFLDCTSPFWLNGFPEPSLSVGIYEGTSNPGATLPLITTINLPLIDSSSIVPVPVGGCTVGTSVCLYQATYEGIIDLPLSFQGYHIFYDRCCRNGGTINLLNPGNQGLAFHAYIPPSLVNNNSPIFTDVPVPFICVNDTVSILNSAIDTDGDLLIFSFVAPYQGFGSSTNPAPPLPIPLSWPIPNVTYTNATFNQNAPFGTGGFAFINGATGLTQYMSPTTGAFVVAIEIREFRNGNLIGITRRDIQILVLNCPPNPSPNLSSIGGSGVTQHTINECDNLAFPITFTDPNGDSLTLIATGQIFDPSFITPPAVLNTPVSGPPSVTSNFSWTAPCGSAQALPYLFTVSATDDGCPPKTTNEIYEITVLPPTSPSIINGTLIFCPNSVATYTTPPIPGFTFNWTVSGGTINSGQGTNSINVTWGSPGTGTVTVNALNGCGCPSTFIDTNVTILAAPFADAGNDATICLGDSVQIGGSPTGPSGSTFTWTPATGLSSTSVPNPMAFPSSTTTYIVTVDNGICPTTDTVTIFVGSATINAGNDTTICIGASVQLNATGGVTYSWTPTTGLSNPNIANPIASPITTTTYVVFVTDAANCSGTDSVTITVVNPPIITISNDTTICTGTCTQLNATGGTSYSWSPTTGLSNPTIANPIACPTVNTTYIVTVSNAANCSATDSVIITINPLPTITANNDTTICNGACATLNVTGGTSYVWSPTTGLSNPNIANPTACVTTQTTYVVTGTDAFGCVNTDTVTISINPLPTITASPDVWVCVGDSVQIFANGGTSYTWSPTIGLSNPNSSNPMAGPLNTTLYVVTGTDANSCSNTDTVIVNVNALPTITAFSDTSVCLGISVQLNATGGNTYTWTPASSLNNATIANPIASPTTTTSYEVTGVDANGCSNKDTITITINALPTINAGTDVAICIGDTTQLQATGGTSYLWTPSSGLSNTTIANPLAFPTVTATYIVIGTDINACEGTDTVVVTINPLPTISAALTDTIFMCAGDSIQLNATGGTSYVWTPNTNITNNTIANPFVFPPTTTTYFVTGSDANSCSNSDSVVVSVFSIPDLSDTVICIGDSIQLLAFGPVGATFSWTPSTGLSNPNIANPFTNTVTTITYTVTVQNLAGCVDTTQITVTAEDKPNAAFTVETTPACDGILAIFDNKTAGADSYLWLFGDGTQSNETNPTHIFPYGASFTTVLNAFSANGCLDTTAFNIASLSFEEQFNLTPPSVLTPNRDGHNDEFRLDLPEAISQCTNIEIFNRWGMKVFESKGQNIGWDGRTTTGAEVPDGTYFYIVDVKGILKKGSITLIR